MTETLIPGYDIISVLGRGDTATVYHAVFSGHQPVALKVLDARLSSDPSFIEHFRQDLKAAANLVHPNIGRVFACGSTGAEPYIASELVEGDSLRAVLRRRVLFLDEAIAVVRGVAAALDHAHENRMLHRDVKPGNILFREDGSAVLVDFGLARCTRLGALVSANLSLRRAPYLAPEVCQGREADPRSDLYSLGIVIFEMLTGRPPFDGHEPMEVYAQHIKRNVPSLIELKPSLPRRLQRVLEKALAKDPSRRYQTGAALAKEFCDACSQGGVRTARALPSYASGAGAERAAPKPAAAGRAVMWALSRPVAAAGAAYKVGKEQSEARRRERERVRAEQKAQVAAEARGREEESRIRGAEQERIREETARIAEEKRLEQERMRQEQQREAEEKRKEQERLAEERRQELARIAEEKRLEEERVREEHERRRREEHRAAEEKRLEEERIARERRREQERLAEEKRQEEARLAEERRQEQLRIAEQKRLEEQRRREAEEEKVRQEKARREEERRREQARIAEEHRLEEERRARARAEEEARKAEAVRAERERREKLRVEKEARQAEELREKQERQAKRRAEEEARRAEERRKEQEERDRKQAEKEAARKAEQERAEEKRRERVEAREQRRRPEERGRVRNPRPMAWTPLAVCAAGVAAFAAIVYLNRPGSSSQAAANPPPRRASAGIAAAPAPAPATASLLKLRFKEYLDAFEAYHQTRLDLPRGERHERLDAFRVELTSLLGDLRKLPAGEQDTGLESDLYREMGTLDWYQARSATARGHWRRAMAVNEKNNLAGAWLRETKGAVLNE